jgi:hypothetical protein
VANKLYTTIMIALVGFALTAPTTITTAFATSSNDTGLPQGKLVGTASPAVYPQINMATISNTTVPISNVTNATSATNEHDYRYGFGRAVDDYKVIPILVFTAINSKKAERYILHIHSTAYRSQSIAS